MSDIERIYPEDMRYNGKTFIHHKARYIMAVELADLMGVKKERALDICCGAGYGANLVKLSGFEEVIAIDNSKEALNYAKSHYQDINFVESDVTKYDTEYSFNLITFFEALEHLPKVCGRNLFKSISKWLNYDGILVISIPKETKNNKFHISNWEFREVLNEIDLNFSHYISFGQNWETAKFMNEPADFLICVCWDGVL